LGLVRTEETKENEEEGGQKEKLVYFVESGSYK